jgi:hypothetical protein
MVMITVWLRRCSMSAIAGTAMALAAIGCRRDSSATAIGRESRVASRE